MVNSRIMHANSCLWEEVKIVNGVVIDETKKEEDELTVKASIQVDTP